MTTNIPWKDQYKHPNWQKKRLEALDAAGFECDDCGTKEDQLHVHHRRYVKGRMIWEYTLDELEVLCADCHETAHKKKDALICLLFGPEGWAVGLDRVLGYATAVISFTDENDEQMLLPSSEFCEGVADAYRVNVDEVVDLAMSNSGVVTKGMLMDLRGPRKHG